MYRTYTPPSNQVTSPVPPDTVPHLGVSGITCIQAHRNCPIPEPPALQPLTTASAQFSVQLCPQGSSMGCYLSVEIETTSSESVSHGHANAAPAQAGPVVYYPNQGIVNQGTVSGAHLSINHGGTQLAAISGQVYAKPTPASPAILIADGDTKQKPKWSAAVENNPSYFGNVTTPFVVPENITANGNGSSTFPFRY